MGSSIVVTTRRLVLRHFLAEDAAFIVELLNQPSFIENIGDKGVRTPEDARRYLDEGPMASYRQFGFGLNLVVLKDGSVPIGMCGLLKRETLDHPDIGFALMPEYCGKGYGYEAAKAVLDHGSAVLGIDKVVAITSEHNEPSARLLLRLGLKFDSVIDHGGEKAKYFA